MATDMTAALAAGGIVSAPDLRCCAGGSGGPPSPWGLCDSSCCASLGTSPAVAAPSALDSAKPLMVSVTRGGASPGESPGDGSDCRASSASHRPARLSPGEARPVLLLHPSEMPLVSNEAYYTAAWVSVNAGCSQVMRMTFFAGLI